MKLSIVHQKRSRIKNSFRHRFVGTIENLEPRFALASITASATETTIYEGGTASYLLQSAPTKPADTFVSYTISNSDNHTILGVRFKIHGEADAYNIDYSSSNVGYQKMSAKLVQGSVADWASGFDLTASQDEFVPNSPDEFDLQDESIDVELILDFTEETWEDYWNNGGTVQQATSTVTINITDNDTRTANMLLRSVDDSAAEPGFGLSTGQVTTVESPNRSFFELVIRQEWRGGGIDIRALGTASPGADYSLALKNPPSGAWIDTISYYQPPSNDPSAINHVNYRVHVPSREGLGGVTLVIELTAHVDSNFTEGTETAEFAFSSPSVPLISYVTTVYSGDPSEGYADVYFDEVRILKQTSTALVNIDDAILATVDIDSNNNGAVERSPEEDAIENISGQGKILIWGATLASTVILDADSMAALGVEDSFSLKLIVSPGLNVWADQEKMMRLSSPDIETIPEDDTLGETYVWSTAWAGTLVVFVEGSSLGKEKTMQWQLVTSSGLAAARDTVRFIVEAQNVILVGIDGTGSAAWLAGPHGRTPDNPSRWNSHVRNLVEVDAKVKFAKYYAGPANLATGSDSDDIHAQAFQYIKTVYVAAQIKPKIALVGWSRGAMIAQWVANDLADEGISVDFVGLYDPVDMASVIPPSAVIVAQGIKNVYVIGPSAVGNFDYPTFTRESGNIIKASNNETSNIFFLMMNASHGSIGGTPGYNDVEDSIFYSDNSEAVNTSYDYVVDSSNSIFADSTIRFGLIYSGIDMKFISGLRYGFPILNPVNTLGN